MASGDVSGAVIVWEVLTGKVIYEYKCEAAVISVSFSSMFITNLLVLDASQTMVVINTMTSEVRDFPGEYVSAVWSRTEPIILAASGRSVHVFSAETSNLIRSIENIQKKEIMKVIPGNRSPLFTVLDKVGEAAIYSMELDNVVTTIQNQTSGDKWTCGCFNNDDQYVFFSSSRVALCTLTGFSTESGMLKSELKGPSEAVGDLIFHPLWSHIYSLACDSRGSDSIRIWTPTYLNSWSKFVPGFTDVIENDIYYERESEFDEEETRPEDVRNTEQDPIDVYTETTQYIFPDDEKYPNQLIYLPLDITAMLKT